MNDVPMMQKLEFIGGPEDGAKHEIPRTHREWLLPVPKPMPLMGSRNELEEFPTMLEQEVYVYRKTTQRTASGMVRMVMVYEGVKAK